MTAVAFSTRLKRFAASVLLDACAPVPKHVHGVSSS